MNKKLIIGVFFILNLNSGDINLKKMLIWSLKAPDDIKNLDLRNLLKNFDPKVDLINSKIENKNQEKLDSEFNKDFKRSIVLNFYSEEQK
jgi:hypothetical protein